MSVSTSSTSTPTTPLSAPSMPLPHVAYVELHGWTPASDAGDDAPAEDEAWLAVCYRITPRLERVSATCALLDLGSCTDGETQAAGEGLLQRLAALGGGGRHARVRIGIGTNVLCAQLALLAPGAVRGEPPIRVLSADEAPAVVRVLPVRWLPPLHPAGTVPLEAVERLERYGLRTLGQVARLGEAALRRQFGDRLGALLAAAAAGRDLRPLIPTPQPATLRCRIAFAATGQGASPQRALATLAQAAREIARRLAMQGRQTARLRLVLTWQAGGVSAGQVRLRTPTADAGQLTRRLSDLCGTLLLAGDGRTSDSDGWMPDGSMAAAPSMASLIEQMLVEVGDLVPLVPEQAAFWQTHARRWAAVGEVAERLARRYGRPRLARAQCTAPHAIVPAERYRLLPLGAAADLEGSDSRSLARRIDWVQRAAADTSTDTPWERVPHRLHWW